jgi:HxlR-like helix-turn-helix protein
MDGYQQYCPIARATEVLGERWTFIIVRNLLLGCETFTEIESGAPGMSRSLVRDRLPAGRVVVRFNFHGYGNRKLPLWLIIQDRESELCVKRPGFDEDLVVDADAEAFVKWHMGWVAWPDAVRSGHITVAGPRSLAKAFPTWNKLSRFAGVTPEASRV